MIHDTIQATIAPVSADEHSGFYLESQKRMRQAIEQADENGIDSTPSPLVANCSASRTVESTMIIEVTLRDVNGQEIDRYLRYVKIGVDFRTELEARTYNDGVETENQLEDKLVDRKVRTVIAAILQQTKGSNKAYISNKIREAGYEPKAVKNLVDNIQFLDRNYD